jgi:hypothetical protein
MKKKNKKKKSQHRRKAARPRAKTRNPRQQRSSRKPRKAKRRPSSGARRNAAALLQALQEGAGFALGDRALRSLTSRRKTKKRKPARKAARKTHAKKKPRHNPAGKHAVAVGGGRRQLIFAGSKQKITRLAGQLRAVLGKARVRTGRVARRTPGKKKAHVNPGLIGTVGEALIFASVFEGMDILKKKLMGEKH